MKIRVLHGPDLHLFKRRTPHIYGTTTLAQIDQRLHALAAECGAERDIRQSNPKACWSTSCTHAATAPTARCSTSRG